MSLAVAQTNEIQIKQRISDIQERLLIITSHLMLQANRAASVGNQKSAQTNLLKTQYQEDNQGCDSFEDYLDLNLPNDFDMSLTEINLAEKLLEQEKLTLETEIKSLQTLEESVSSAIDKNIKNNFSYFKN